MNGDTQKIWDKLELIHEDVNDTRVDVAHITGKFEGLQCEAHGKRIGRLEGWLWKLGPGVLVVGALGAAATAIWG